MGKVTGVCSVLTGKENLNVAGKHSHYGEDCVVTVNSFREATDTPFECEKCSKGKK
jgi:hypothetical protein